MPYFSPEVVQQVKQIDLLTYLKTYEPYELVCFSGNTYTTRTHDSLKISNGRWMWWSQGIGGRAALKREEVLSDRIYEYDKVKGRIFQMPESMEKGREAEQ